MLSSLQDLLVPMGGAADESADLAGQLSALAVDLGSFNNMNTSSTFNDITSAMTGSFEVMKKYGVVLSQATVNQELLNRSLDPAKVTAFQKAQAAVAIIMRSTTAAQGDAIRTADGYANSVKRLRSAFEDLLAAAGMPFLDMLAKASQEIKNATDGITKFIAENKKLADAIATSTVSLIALGTAFTGVGIAAKAASAGMLISRKAIAAVSIAGKTGVKAIKTYGIAIGGITSLASRLTMGLEALWIVMSTPAITTTSAAFFVLMSPLAGLIAAIGTIAAVVGTVTVLFADWGVVMQDVKKIAGDVASTFTGVVQAIQGAFSGFNGSTLAGGLLDAFKLTFAGVGILVIDLLDAVGKQIGTAFTRAFFGLRDLTTATLESIFTGLDFLFEKPIEAIKMGFESLFSGIVSSAKKLFEFLSNPRAALVSLRDSVLAAGSSGGKGKPDDKAADVAGTKELSKAQEELNQMILKTKQAYDVETKGFRQRTAIAIHGEEMVQRAKLKTAGYSDREIEAYERQKRAVKGLEDARKRHLDGLKKQADAQKKYAETIRDLLLTEKQLQRVRMAADGFSPRQIGNIERLQARKQQREDRAEFSGQQRDNLSSRRSDLILDAGKSLIDATGSVEAGMKRIKELADEAFRTGKITKETFRNLKLDAPGFQSEQTTRIEELRREIKQSNETTTESLKREFLQDAANIKTAFGDDPATLKAQFQLRLKRFKEDSKELKEQGSGKDRENFTARGQTGTFSSFAVGSLAANAFGSTQERQLDQLALIANNTKRLTKKNGGFV